MSRKDALSENSTSKFSYSLSWVMHPAFVPACFILGLAIRILTAAFLPIEQFSDSAWYVARATELTQGMGYQESGFPTAYWPVGWPAILAGAMLIFKSSSVAVIVLNLIAAAVIMSLIMWFCRYVICDEVTARLSILAYIFYLNHVAYIGLAATETVYTALVMLAFAVLVGGRSRKALLVFCGLLFGVATLVKPQTIAFPFGAIIALVIVYREYSWRRGLAAGVLVYVALIAVVLPWSARNMSVFGEFVLVSTNGGVALMAGANDEATASGSGLVSSDSFAEIGIPWEERVERQVELNAALNNYAMDWIIDNKYDYLALMPKKVVNIWIKDTDGFWAYDYNYPEAGTVVKIFQIVNQAYYTFIILLSLPALYYSSLAVLRQSRDSAPLALLFCMPLFITLLAAVFSGQIRYHFPAMPFLIMAAAWTVTRLCERKR